MRGGLCHTVGMSDMWKMAARRSSEFDSSAVAYDRYRPQYPNGIFEDIIELQGSDRAPRRSRSGLEPASVLLLS